MKSKKQRRRDVGDINAGNGYRWFFWICQGWFLGLNIRATTSNDFLSCYRAKILPFNPCIRLAGFPRVVNVCKALGDLHIQSVNWLNRLASFCTNRSHRQPTALIKYEYVCLKINDSVLVFVSTSFRIVLFLRVSLSLDASVFPPSWRFPSFGASYLFTVLVDIFLILTYRFVAIH